MTKIRVFRKIIGFHATLSSEGQVLWKHMSTTEDSAGGVPAMPTSQRCCERRPPAVLPLRRPVSGTGSDVPAHTEARPPDALSGSEDLQRAPRARNGAEHASFRRGPPGPGTHQRLTASCQSSVSGDRCGNLNVGSESDLETSHKEVQREPSHCRLVWKTAFIRKSSESSSHLLPTGRCRQIRVKCRVSLPQWRGVALQQVLERVKAAMFLLLEGTKEKLSRLQSVPKA